MAIREPEPQASTSNAYASVETGAPRRLTSPFAVPAAEGYRIPENGESEATRQGWSEGNADEMTA
jgi:hypothetical protein